MSSVNPDFNMKKKNTLIVDQETVNSKKTERSNKCKLETESVITDRLSTDIPLIQTNVSLMN